MRYIGLIDSSFTGQASLGLGGENTGEGPLYVTWERHNYATGLTVYTDKHLRDAIGKEGRKMALLVEPPSLHRGHYDLAFEMHDVFETILSPWLLFAYRHPVFRHYPIGGSWISQSKWGLNKEHKERHCSIIISQKTGAIGHRIRGQVVERLGKRFGIDEWGRRSRPMESKVDALRPYHYSIVVESIACYGYFSEKLVDCISMGTVPLYWGAPDVHNYFPGIPTWSSYYELEELLTHPPHVPDVLMSQWIDFAHHFRCPEDWLYKRGVFDE